MLISLRLGELCNKNCEYCDYQDIQQIKYLDEDKFKHNSKYLFSIINKNNLYYTITGGETGLIKPSVYDYIFDRVSIPAIIATNGLFIENDYHNKYVKSIRTIYYHCTDDVLKDEKVKKINAPNIEYFILVHKNNLKHLDEFLKVNNDIVFTIKLIENRSITSNTSLLDLQDINTLKNILTRNTNIKKTILNQLDWYINNINNIHNIRMSCSRICYTPQIDFVHNVIRKCYKSYTLFPTIELTDSNLYKLFKLNVNEFKSANNVCTNCTYLYNFMNQKEALMSKINLRSNIERVYYESI